jgi:hypothetical protein
MPIALGVCPVEELSNAHTACDTILTFTGGGVSLAISFI